MIAVEADHHHGHVDGIGNAVAGAWLGPAAERGRRDPLDGLEQLVRVDGLGQNIRAALETSDATALSGAAHARKGSIGLFSAAGYDAARRLELVGHEGTLAETPGALERIEAGLARQLPSIRQLAEVDGGTYKEDSWRLR